MVQDRYSVLKITGQKIVYICNLKKDVNEINMNCLILKQLPIFEIIKAFNWKKYTLHLH